MLTRARKYLGSGSVFGQGLGLVGFDYFTKVRVRVCRFHFQPLGFRVSRVSSRTYSLCLGLHIPISVGSGSEIFGFGFAWPLLIQPSSLCSRNFQYVKMLKFDNFTATPIFREIKF